MTSSFPKHVPQARNLEIFWAATLERKSQGELAREHNLSQQRVSQIVRAVRRFVALATSEQYEGVPQKAQLQLSCRVQLARLEQRRWEMSRAWKESTRPKWSVKRVQSASGERVETVEKSQHGDWRIDRQLGEIDQQIVDTTRLLYEREWFGEEAARMRNSELGMRNEGGVAALGGVEDAVLGTEYSVLGTDEAAVVASEVPTDEGQPTDVRTVDLIPGAHAEPAIEASNEPTAEAEPVPTAPESAIRNPHSAIAPSIESAQPQALIHRASPPPTCSLTGQLIQPPSDDHRPWRRVFLPTEWLLANPTASGTTPQGVLWKLAPALQQVAMDEAGAACGSGGADLGWDELERAEQDAFESSEMLVGV